MSVLNSCGTLGMTCSQMETILLFHILLSVKYPHVNKLAKLNSGAYSLFYRGKLFQSLMALLWSTCNPCWARNLLEFFLPFHSTQLVNMASSLPKKTVNSNDVGCSNDALNILLICLSGSKTPVFLMENLTCSICIFSSTFSLSSGQF